MTLFDGDDRKAIGQVVGALVVLVGALALTAVSSAGILGLAIRVFELAHG